MFLPRADYDAPLQKVTQRAIISAGLFLVLVLGICGGIAYINAQNEKSKSELIKNDIVLKLIEKESRLKSEFLSNITHEIRTPLSGMIGMLYLLSQENVSPRLGGHFLVVENTAKLLLNIINDVLDILKIQTGEFELEAVPFSLEAVIDDVLNMINTLGKDRDIDLIVDMVPSQNFNLIGDPIRLQQILTNLLSNAIKFTEQGFVKITVDESVKIGTHVHFVISVEDSGIGIEPERIDTLFLPFKQADASITRKYGGAGLGLAIVRQLVEMMGGSITVTSEPGRGSIFKLELSFEASQSKREYRPYSTANFKDLSVLIVDDDRTSLEAMRKIVSGFGCKVTLAENASEALLQYKFALKARRKFDVVLLDCRLQDQDGRMIAHRMQKMEYGNKDNILLLETAHGAERLLEQQDDTLDYDFLIKPVTPSSLFDTLVKFTDQTDMTSQQLDEIWDGNTTNDKSILAQKRILLAEDNILNQKVAALILEGAGAEVVVANTGKEAVDILSEDRNFDAVLMDVQMPVMDGLTAVREIRETLRLRDLPIIALTANASKEDRERCLRIGMDAYSSKPFKPEQLFDVIQEAV